MARFTYRGVVVEVSDENAANLSADYKPVTEEKSTKKAPAKRSASSKTEK